jgi:hypothetical protein
MSDQATQHSESNEDQAVEHIIQQARASIPSEDDLVPLLISMVELHMKAVCTVAFMQGINVGLKKAASNVVSETLNLIKEQFQKSRAHERREAYECVVVVGQASANSN